MKQFKEQRVANEIFVMDDSFQLIQLIQNLEDEEYECIERHNLAEIPSLAIHLRNLKLA